MVENLRVTKQQFIDIFIARYKRIYCQYPKLEILKKVEEGSAQQFDSLENEGLILINTIALQKRSEETTLRTTPEVRRFIQELIL